MKVLDYEALTNEQKAMYLLEQFIKETDEKQRHLMVLHVLGKKLLKEVKNA